MEDDDRKVVPEELIFEILKEVPAKSLLRFRCVSKLWRSIIDDSNFVHCHRSRSYSRPDATDLLLLVDGDVPDVVSLYSVNTEGQCAPTLIDRLVLHQAPPQLWYVNVKLCYVNGLISSGNWIYNPSTRQSKLLPRVKDGIGNNNKNKDGTYYLGFDHSTKLYKVLAKSHFNSKQPYIYNVLTLGTNSWRNVGDPVSILHGGSKIEYTQMVHSNCANGVIFLLSWSLCSVELPRLHAFEVGDEKLRVIALPKDLFSNFMIQYSHFDLLLADDCPALIFEDNDMLTIWILEDYAKQIWKMEHIQYPRQWQLDGLIQYPLQREIGTDPLGTIHKKKILFRSEIEIRSNHVVLFFYYDIQSKTSTAIPREVFCVLENQGHYDAMVTKHVETLFKLN